jgi:hypothetical protein
MIKHPVWGEAFNSLFTTDEKTLVTFGWQYTQEFVSDLFTPARHIILGIGIARPDFEHFTDFDRANALLGFQQWAWTGHGTRVNHFCSLERIQIN